MKIDITFKIIALISPFIAAFLTYYFGVRSKRKDIDIEKEKELNTILSNLLNVWYYLTRIESVVEIISQDDKSTLFPKKFLPGILLNTGYLKDDCFRELDESNKKLKKYDPIAYYKLEGIGESLDLIKKQYIMPFLNTPNLDKEIVISGTKALLNETLEGVKENLGFISKLISRKTKKRIKEFINDYSEQTGESILNELDFKYYELMMQTFPVGIEIPTFEEFKESADLDEFKQLQEIQLKIALEGKLNEALNVMAENPDISMDDLLNEMEKVTLNTACSQ